MINIMFVCTGNICRSAMAEKLLKKKLQDLGMSQKVEAYSCGTYAEADDTPTYEATTVMMKKYGIDMTSHRATPIRDSKIYDMDLILCMTNSHKNTLKLVCPDLVDRIFLLREYAGLDGEISDPYGGTIKVYEECINDIEKCLDLLIKKEFGGV